MTKTYTLNLNSNDTTGVDKSGGIANYKYYVNWGSFLPHDVKKFELQFTFRSVIAGDDLQNIALISIDTGLIYSSGANSSSNVIGSVSPQSFETSAGPGQYYFAGPASNGPVQIGKPSTDYITVGIKYADNTVPTASFPNYVLHLTLREIE